MITVSMGEISEMKYPIKDNQTSLADFIQVEINEKNMRGTIKVPRIIGAPNRCLRSRMCVNTICW